MAKTKAERLLNLVIALLNASRFRDVNWIRENVDGYDQPRGDESSDEAFFRMFERDKGELRELGIPLQTNADGAYRIPPGEFALPEMSFTPAETAALALAGRLWETTVLAEAGSGAIRKLTDAAGSGVAEPVAPDTVTLLQPRVRTSDPAFAPLYAAVQSRRVVTFDYRKGSTEPADNRRFQPWGLVSWKGRWYVVGFDEQRQAQRTFRLSRISSDVIPVGRAGAVKVPPDLDLMSIVMNSVPAEVPRVAVLLLATGTAAGLRRKATELPADPDHPGFDRVQIQMDHLWDTARTITGLGPDAVVESPPDLVHAVVRLLQGARGAVSA